MKKIILFILFLFLTTVNIQADLVSEHDIQTKIDTIGTDILNKNKIQTHIIFTYNKQTRKSALKSKLGLRKNQIILYDGIYQSAETDDEIAAILSRHIYIVNQINKKLITKMSNIKEPKFYEFLIDKKAVDYMVNANYNPVALITYLNKTNPEYKFSLRHNKTKDRLITIYEYILLKYPKYLSSNDEYINNPHFQNFLLNTVLERRFLQEKLYNKGKTFIENDENEDDNEE